MIRNSLSLLIGIAIGAAFFAMWHSFYSVPKYEDQLIRIQNSSKSQIKDFAEEIADIDAKHKNVLYFTDVFTNSKEGQLEDSHRIFVKSCVKRRGVLDVEGCFAKAYQDKIFSIDPKLVSDDFITSKKVEQGAAANP